MSDDDTFDAVIVTNPNLPPSKKAKAKRAQLTADLARQASLSASWSTISARPKLSEKHLASQTKLSASDPTDRL
jgi:hypothetical protein